MAQPRPLISRSLTSRVSLTSVGQMPVIDEDEEVRVCHKIPTAPPRVPQRSYRRSMARGLPPPYVPTTHLPPVYRPPYLEAAERKKAADLEAGKEAKAGATPKSKLRKLPAAGCDFKCGAEQRSCWFITIVAVIMAIVVGLAVGLTIGLKDKNKSNHTSPATSSSFPVGSFSFNTSLQRTRTDCTSNPSTWRCYPYEEGSFATFSWIISSINPHTFSISSSDNPFAPSFDNVTMNLIDGNQPTERFVFSFSTDKTVVPSDVLSPTNRAARCTFEETDFEATIWTRRRGDEVVNPPRRSDDYHFIEWPGDVQVSQTKKPQVGSLKCEDSQGTAIADVQTGAGDCECGYGNFPVR